MVLCCVHELAGATCTDCDSGEESVLLQHVRSSEGELELEAASSEWPKWGSDGFGGRCDEEVEATQTAWKKAILRISAAYRDDPNSSTYIQLAEDAINELYGYDIGTVTFKPTLAVEEPFRPTFIGALSYFVGYAATQARGGVQEDKGFAIAAGDTWSKILFFNDRVSCLGNLALAQGYYYFTNAASGAETGVEYSFMYKKIMSGKLKILVHHSSLPAPIPGFPTDASSNLMQGGEEEGKHAATGGWRQYKQAGYRIRQYKKAGYSGYRIHQYKKAGYSGYWIRQYKKAGWRSCEEDVEATQTAWKDAILSISASYRDDPNSPQYIHLAEQAIQKLYGYDIATVMFKPTLAVQEPFRPTYIGALSYFVGYIPTKARGGIEEDKGFAIAAGDTWSEVEFENNQTSCVGDVAYSQGYYYFTNAVSNSRTGVEYSFVYKKTWWGLKIIVHHSSLPASAGR